ncbi:cold-shock protein [Streptomyces misionensis]|uniref:cold-shock protein n=1 Tax=Streptomyces misionensis TaxID=67331 RepID=UPI0036B85CEC
MHGDIVRRRTVGVQCADRCERVLERHEASEFTRTKLVGSKMITGKVIRFDAVRGYGFIAPETGGEDVFLHVNDLLFPESSVRAGVRVEFEVEAGDRGPKAAAVRLSSVTQAPSAVPAAGRPMGDPSVGSADAAAELDEETTVDVLSVAEYTSEVTELLLGRTPWLTGEQITRLRGELVELGRMHGWVED